MKFIAKFLINLVILIVILIACTPLILSTSWGKHMAIQLAHRFYHIDVQVDELNLSWRNGQTITNLQVQDSKNNQLFSCSSITTDASLWKILTRHEIGHLVVVQPKATFYASKTSPTAISLAPAGFVPKLAMVPNIDLDFTGDLELHKGMFDFQAPQLPTVSLTDVELKVSRDVSGKIETAATAASAQGTLELQGTLIPRSQIDVTAAVHKFPVQVFDQFAPAAYRGLATEIVGNMIDINLDLHVRSDLFKVNLDANSPQFSAKIATQTDSSTVTLVAPASIDVKLPPSVLKSTNPVELNITIPEFQLALENQEAFAVRALVQCSGINLPELQIQPWFADIATQNFSQGDFTVLAKSAQLLQPLQMNLKLTSLDQGKITTPLLALANITLENLTLDFQKQGPAIDVQLETSYNGAAVQLTSRLNPAQKSAEFNGTLGNWTTPLLDMPLTVAFQGTASPEAQQVSVQGKSEALSFSATLENKDDTLRLVKPASFTWTLTPDGYDKIDIRLNQRPGPFTLTNDAQIQLRLTALSFPLKAGPSFADIQVQGELSIDEISFTEKATGTVTSLKNIQWQISQAKPGAPLDFKLSSTMPPKGLVQAEGSFDPAQQTTHLSMKVQRFPTPALDLLSRAIGKASLPLSTALGPTIDATITADVKNGSGPLNVNLTSDTAKASLQGLVTNGVLTLSQPLYAQLQMTPELSRELFDLAVESAEAPITIEVPPQGFALPLFPMNVEQIQIPSARIELGKITCRNEGNLNVTLGILKSSQKSSNNSLHLWFAPIDLHVKNGVIDWERTEILITDTFDVCLWGTVDLPKNDVQMILGLTSDALRRAFGIKDLPQKYVLHIPITGTLSNVKINTGAATAKVAALMLWQKKAAAGGSLRGPAGALLGELVNKLGPLPDGDAKTPPAKKPFPWDSSTSQVDEPPVPQKKKKHFRADDKPLKQIIKMIR